MENWPLQDAKAKFSFLIKTVLKEGAQVITRHGEPTAVILAYKDYKHLSGKSKTLSQFLLSAPRADLEIDRATDYDRAVEL
jgi:prevent-host-death family protein